LSWSKPYEKKLSNEFIKSYKAFSKSDVFENINDYSQSDYEI
tara:strand:+ start:430 stop:555 length:126 start_codon:yes stop_codon:yes gene_type:complete